MTNDIRQHRSARWYFGGMASAIATCFTHPLDLMKVHKQTHDEKLATIPLAMQIFSEQGISGFYSGLSASFLRQCTYSMARFGMYEVGKDMVDTSTMVGKCSLAGFAGLCGGLIGTPADMINVRMQNDIKLDPENRRNYKHCIDGLVQVYKTEGFRSLFSGASTASVRGALMTIGQIACYEQFKKYLLRTAKFKDDVGTHFLASMGAATAATILSQPLDVMKTRAMSAEKGEYSGLWHIVLDIAQSGPLGFYKGFIPAFIRLGPQTILTFIFLEQLRLNFGLISTKV